MKKEISKILFFTLVLSLLIFLIFGQGLFFAWRMSFLDKLFLSSQPSPKIIILEIDNQSINELGRWPWDREIHARLLDKICAQNPSVVGVDINFSESSKPDSDKKLAQALATCPEVVLPLPADIDLSSSRVRANSLTPPLPEFSRSASLGVINSPLDSDGVFRRGLVKVSGPEGEEYYSFAAQVALNYQAQDKLPSIPLDSQGRMLVNYAGKPGGFTSVSVYDFLKDQVQISLKDKIVLIGATAPDLHDNHIVPTSRGIPMNGVEIHANAVNTIILEDFLIPVKDYIQIIVLVVLIFLTCLCLFHFNLLKGSLFVSILLIFYLVFALWLFDLGYVLDLFCALLAILFTYICVVVYRNLTDRREKKKIRQAFSRYVSTEVIEEILAHPEKLKLGGESRELAVLFSDIRSFTEISEKISAPELVSFLNEYLSVMSALIMKEGGVVDKYIGDAIMAFWGAPISRGRYSERSCRAALSMISQLKEHSPTWEKKFGFAPKIGIGINTGEVIVGNIGSDQRFDYTVMGDAVNLASRLEGLTKKYGVEIIVSSFTQAQAGEEFVFRYLDKVAVKGKKESVEIFELVGTKTGVSEEEKKYITEFSKMVRHFQAREWDTALKIISRLKANRAGDRPLELYEERCQRYKQNPPEPDWDGVEVLKEK